MAVRGGGRAGISTQKEEIHAALQQRLKKGDTWYLVDVRWMKQWKKYVGYDNGDQSSAGQETANPGPMDNSNLFKGGRLREHLMDEINYFLLTETAWRKLSSWYGLSSGSKVVARKVVEYGLYNKHCKVEVYLLEFKLCVHPNLNDIRKREFSRADTVSMLEQVLREIYEVNSSTECRVWHRYMTHTYELLSKLDQPLQHAGLYNGQMIVLEKKNSNGSWPRSVTASISTRHPTHPDDSFGSFGAVVASGSSSLSSSNSQQPSSPGLCGLSNLGNTGYINSVLQCLSNSAPLTEYFLGTQAGYQPYKKHINKDNPLGMGGAIAEAYGALLEDVWSGKVNVAAMKKFKTQVDRFASRFVEHDLLGFLTFMLDGLHDDLNLVKKKPYVDMTVKTEGRSESDIAEETWYKYLQHNQSIIVKLFQGQLRSTLFCPDCSQVHKKFEPFKFLSLRLPKKTRTLSVYLVRIDPMTPVVKFKVKVPKRSIIWNFKEELGALTGIDAKQLVIVDVYNSRFHRIYSDKDPLTNILDRNDIYAYELECQSSNDERKMVHVPIYMREGTERQYSYQQYSCYYHLFGFPTVVYVPAECTYRSLYTAIVNKMRRYIRLWSEVKDEKEQDLFRLVVVNSYGSEDVRKLVDDPKKMLQLSGSTYVACDWEGEAKECYDEDLAKEYDEHVSCHDCPEANGHLQLMDCFEQFTSKETLSKEKEWYCPQCKDHVQGSKKSDLWSLPEILVVHLNKRFADPDDTQGDDKPNDLIEFPVSGLDLSEYSLKEDNPQPLYDLYAISNHSGNMDDGHYNAYAKNKDTGKWYNFDDNDVSEITEDKLVVKTGDANVLFYHRRMEPMHGFLELSACKVELLAKSSELASVREDLKVQLTAKDSELAMSNENLVACQTELEACKVELSSQNNELVTLKQELEATKKELAAHNIDVWKVSRDRVRMEKEIGNGGWGAVFEGRIQVAIKRFHPAILTPHNLSRFQREMRLLAKVQHPNLVQFIGAVLDEQTGTEPPLIITELLDMNLREAYEQKELQPRNCLSIFIDVSRALDYLHQRYEPIIHRDVSAPNVLLQRLPNSRWKGKVSDLGSANFLQAISVYSPPEVIPQAFDPDAEPPMQSVKIDVYSYGVVLCEVSASQFPSADKYRDMIRQVQREQPQMYALIVRCTKKDPKNRPTMAEVLLELENIPQSQ